MLRLAVMLWALAGTVLAGVLMIVVLLVPSLNQYAMKYIPIAAALGVIVAVPVAIAAAKAILARTAES